MVTICKKCKFVERHCPAGDPGGLKITGVCLSPDAPIHNFVEGRSSCYELNSKGDCVFFQSSNVHKGGEL